MLKSHEQFHSSNGKRRILVVDDEIINREMLGAYLKKDFEVLFACNGKEALEIIQENKETLSLVLLDIMMPVMNGIELLEIVREDKELSRIPIIVLTADKKTEIRSLNLGAADFIPKPYPEVDIILARVWRIIELSEDRDIIQSTERDQLTGLYNKEYFFRYAQQYDQHHKKKDMDAITIDINHFHMINERYGRKYGDEVLHRIAGKLQAIVKEDGGIVCRRGADVFMVYCPHRIDYQDMLKIASEGIAGEESADNRIRLRMGVYSHVDKNIDIERRFDRAKIAADNVKGSFTKTIAFYDDDLHAKELYTEQLVEDFYKAIEEKQFIVHYQPKYNIKGEQPVLSSAEALVRWNHPDLGMISPGVFIPLFEENGLIQVLDRYVWRETCRQIRDWRDRLGKYVPVSANVSRVDLYDPGLISALQDLIREFRLSYQDLMLEVTESAYTQDAEQIIGVVEKLKKLGFVIEMDDFGTGYSSLNMVSSLPFDVLKLDMHFTRTAFSEGGNTRMLELIMDIAEYLAVPVIAEGVETREQMETLRAMGCDLVQGYYFSKPVAADEFEKFLIGKSAQMDDDNCEEMPQVTDSSGKDFFEEITEEPKEGEEVDKEKEAEISGEKPSRPGIQLRTATYFFLIISLVASIALFAADMSVTRGYRRMEKASDRYISAQLAASDMESGSDYLTDRVRCFVVTGEVEYLKDYLQEVNITKTRDKAVDNLSMLLEDTSPEALASLNTALALSNELVITEYQAIRLKLETGNYDLEDVPKEIWDVKLNKDEIGLSKEEKNQKAQSLVFDNNYMHFKDNIRENVSNCTQELIRASSQQLEEASSRMSLLVMIQTAITIVFLLVVLVIVLFINEQIRKPLTNMVEMMQLQKPIPMIGAEELQFVGKTYNVILKENETAHEKLKHEASHDALTGLLNRGAYDLMMKTVDTSHIALIIIDVDYFKSVNDTYGHAVGDRVLKRVADILRQSFRSVDVICRIGGDEFVVIMTRVNKTMKDLVKTKIRQMNEMLQHPQDDLPPVSLSVGIAFSDRDNPKGDIFKDADTALYRVKEAGRNGCEVY